MKKKIVTWGVLLVMLAQILTGCNNQAADPSSGNGKGDTLKLAIVAKGYGDEFLKQLASAYQEKTGVKTELVKSSSDSSWVSAQLLSGAKLNDVDLYFDINNAAMYSVAQKNYLAGYERAFIDLSDIYDEVPEGYGTDKKLKELVGEYAMRAVTWDLDGEGYGDGKQYFVSYVTAMEGLLYNVDLFEKYNLSVPKTTNEFFALMDSLKTINKGSYAVNSAGRKIYPYVYSGKANYSNMIGRVWWAQYDGLQAYYNIWKGQNENGEYTADSQKPLGKLSAMQHVAKILNYDSGYTSEVCYDQNFTTAQVLFLDKQAFMMTTGDWVEREMSGNYGDAQMNIAFMRIPVNSDIVKKCDSIKTEAQLVEAISYVDGDVTERPGFLSDADLARIQEARSIYSCEANQHIAYIPAYSNMVDEAKDFLRFMLSKEGQEIMLEYAYGNMAPLNVNVTEFEQFNSLSPLQKSKYELMTSGSGMSFVGENRSHPVSYAGGILDFYAPQMDYAFGAITTSGTYMTPMELWESNYEYKSGSWADILAKAGVSN